jgi:hypothetical protein
MTNCSARSSQAQPLLRDGDAGYDELLIVTDAAFNIALVVHHTAIVL